MTQTTNSPTTDTSGRFVRADSQIRNWVTADGAAGPSGTNGYEAAPGRYHLYVALNCPWAHRTVIFRALKNLQDIISMSIVMPQRTDAGWTFGDYPGSTPDTINGFKYLREAYFATVPDYDGRFTVPVLWDKERNVVVNNESSEIIRMFNEAFNAYTDDPTDYYPQHLRATIDKMNDYVYANVNNGVYRAGFARSQEAYEEGYDMLFEAFDTLEQRLDRQRYLAGEQITEADWRLFPTLVRFELAYHGVFKCNKQRLIDYRNLWGYTCELYQVDGVADTVNADHIKAGYWRQGERNPIGTIPKGPEIDFMATHDRDRLPARGQ